MVFLSGLLEGEPECSGAVVRNETAVIACGGFETLASARSSTTEVGQAVAASDSGWVRREEKERCAATLA